MTCAWFPNNRQQKTSTAQKPETLNLGLSVPGMLEFRLPKPRCTHFMDFAESRSNVSRALATPHPSIQQLHRPQTAIWTTNTASKSPFTIDPGFSVKAQGLELKVGISHFSGDYECGAADR